MCKKKNRKMIRSRRRKEHEKKKNIFLVSTKLQNINRFLDSVICEIEKNKELFAGVSEMDAYMMQGIETKMLLIHVIAMLQEQGYAVPSFYMPKMGVDCVNSEDLFSAIEEASLEMLYEFPISDCFDVFEDIEHRELDVVKGGADYDFFKEYTDEKNKEKAKGLREALDSEGDEDDFSLVVHFFRCKRLGRLMTCMEKNPGINERYAGLKEFVEICEYQMMVPFAEVFTDFSTTFHEKNYLDAIATVGYSNGWCADLCIGCIGPLAIATYTVMHDMFDYLEKNIPELHYMMEREEKASAELQTA